MKKIIFGTITALALIAFTSNAYASDTKTDGASCDKNSTKTMKCGAGKCGGGK